jgi:hypothetical protein
MLGAERRIAMEDIFHVYPGQRVVTSHGAVRVVAFVRGHEVFVFTPRGGVERAVVRYDALGGDAGVRVEGAYRELAA